MKTGKTIGMITEQTKNPDGSITLRPVAVDDQREIGTAQAGKMLGLGREAIYRLCDLGEKAGGLKAWKLPCARGNSHWRISLGSVLSLRVRNSPAR